jgi:hypothetical protein
MQEHPKMANRLNICLRDHDHLSLLNEDDEFQDSRDRSDYASYLN